MTPTETAAKLRVFNDWRRGELDDLSMPDPREIGEAIDAAIEMIERMEKQVPVGWFARIDGDGPLMECKHADISRVPLYLAPGAHPKLDEIKIALHRALELGKRETWTGAKKYRSREDQCEEQQCWNKVWTLLDAKGE